MRPLRISENLNLKENLNKITHNGKQYEKGKWYQFKGAYMQLTKYNMFSEAPFVMWTGSQECHCPIIDKIDPETLGTITDAPIELEEGCWYMTDRCFPMLWSGSEWQNSRVSSTVDQDFTPLYKMERAK